MGTGPVIGGVALTACILAGWIFVRRPIRQLIDGIQFERGRHLFRQQREWLEARFLKALAISDPLEAIRWDDARWLNEVYWVRDRQTGRLLALVGVEFDVNPFDDGVIRHATAFFEYRKARWIADGKHVDALQPSEALLRQQRYEPVPLPPRHV